MHLVNLPEIQSNEVQNLNTYLFPSKLITELKQPLLPCHHQIINRNFQQLKSLFIRLVLGLVGLFFFPPLYAVSVQTASTIKSGHNYSNQIICFVKQLFTYKC